MCERLTGEHVHRGFRLVGEQDVFEGVCPKDRLGIQLAVVERESSEAIESRAYSGTHPFWLIKMAAATKQIELAILESSTDDRI